MISDRHKYALKMVTYCTLCTLLASAWIYKAVALNNTTGAAMLIIPLVLFLLGIIYSTALITHDLNRINNEPSIDYFKKETK